MTNMKRIILAAGVGMIMSNSMARAENACNAEIEQTKSDWQSLKLRPADKPTGWSAGVNGHRHIMSEVNTMRFHLKWAEDLCEKGSDHEALLHLDVIHAFLKLPEVAHPVDHHYLFNNESK